MGTRKKRPTTIDEVLDAVEAVDLLEGMPRRAQSKARAHLRERCEDPSEDWPVARLASVWVDHECIESEGDYARLLERFGEGAFGIFAPTEVEERWRDGVATLSFRWRGKRYEARIPVTDDWVHDAFFALLDRALAGGRCVLRFRVPDLGWGQASGYMFVHPDAFGRAVAAGLLPRDGSRGRAADGEFDQYTLPDDAETYLRVLHEHRFFRSHGETLTARVEAQVRRAYELGVHPSTGLSVFSARIPRKQPTPAYVKAMLAALVEALESLPRVEIIGGAIEVGSRLHLTMGGQEPGQYWAGWFPDSQRFVDNWVSYVRVLLSLLQGRSLGPWPDFFPIIDADRQTLHICLGPQQGPLQVGSTWICGPGTLVPDNRRRKPLDPSAVAAELWIYPSPNERP